MTISHGHRDCHPHAPKTTRRYTYSVIFPGNRMRNTIAGIVAVTLILIVACTETPTEVRLPANLSVRDAKGGGGGSADKTKSVSLQPSSATLAIGGTTQLTGTSKPPGATLVWGSSNNSVATVNQSGIVTAISAGSATITATADGKSGSAAITVSGPQPPGEILLTAGDISTCANNDDEATAKLLDANPQGLIALLGDNVYETATRSDYDNCYHPTWGRHLARTKPSAGNHEYATAGAAGYFGYFGAAAGDPAKGYYSYNHGAWHIIVLNSNIARDAASTQVAWLRADLSANSGAACTLAYWHHPRFSSATHGNNTSVQSFWDVLYEFNADVVLAGHDHSYERFAPQSPTGVADATRGIRSFVVGTGGRSHYSLGTRKANSQVFNGSTSGIMKLTLDATSYAWEFIPVAGQTFTDSGTGACH